MTTTEHATAKNIFDTVGELQAFLAGLPPETPLAEHYDGSGRISGVWSEYGDWGLVALYKVDPQWLADHNEATVNPLIAGHFAKETTV